MEIRRYKANKCTCWSNVAISYEAVLISAVGLNNKRMQIR